MATCARSHGNLCKVPWQLVQGPMATCARSHGNLCKVPWQPVQGPMATCARSHGNLCKVPWQPVQGPMATCARSRDNLCLLHKIQANYLSSIGPYTFALAMLSLCLHPCIVWWLVFWVRSILSYSLRSRSTQLLVFIELVERSC